MLLAPIIKLARLAFSIKLPGPLLVEIVLIATVDYYSVDDYYWAGIKQLILFDEPADVVIGGG